MKCVIPCAGMGTRMGLGKPKALLEVKGIPVLWGVIKQWAGTVDNFVIIVSPENEAQIREWLRKVAVDAEFAVQERPEGLADAILQAEPYVEGKFVVNLGDCLFRGKFRPNSFDLGIGVWETNNLVEINKSYLVGVSPMTKLVEDVIEKPNLKVPHGNCGMGVYFLASMVFDYIRKAKVAPSGGDFTCVIQNMIDAGENISPVWFGGRYINITYPEDLKKAEAMVNV